MASVKTLVVGDDEVVVGMTKSSRRQERFARVVSRHVKTSPRHVITTTSFFGAIGEVHD